MSIKAGTHWVGELDSFGPMLKYLRRRAHLTQRALGLAVGYSEAQISRMEHGHRPPDLAAITALFVPALCIEDQPQLINRFVDLAVLARGEPAQASAAGFMGAVLSPARLLSLLAIFNLRFDLNSMGLPGLLRKLVLQAGPLDLLAAGHRPGLPKRTKLLKAIPDPAACAAGTDVRGAGRGPSRAEHSLLVEAHCALGTIACLRGQPDQALEHFQQAVELARKDKWMNG